MSYLKIIAYGTILRLAVDDKTICVGFDGGTGSPEEMREHITRNLKLRKEAGDLSDLKPGTILTYDCPTDSRTRAYTVLRWLYDGLNFIGVQPNDYLYSPSRGFYLRPDKEVAS